MWHGDYIRRFIEGADGGRDLLIIAQTPGLCRQPQGRLLRAQNFCRHHPRCCPGRQGGDLTLKMPWGDPDPSLPGPPGAPLRFLAGLSPSSELCVTLAGMGNGSAYPLGCPIFCSFFKIILTAWRCCQMRNL